MKKLTIAAALTVSAVLLSTVTAQAASSNANAEIVAAISISNSGGLQFGQIAPTAAIGTVTVPAAATGTRGMTGGVTLGNGTPWTASSFAVTGTALNTYAITLPSSITLTATTAGAPMVVDTFTSLPTVVAGGTLNAQGTQTLLVGATLHVGVSQAADTYAGTFDVTVAYN